MADSISPGGVPVAGGCWLLRGERLPVPRGVTAAQVWSLCAGWGLAGAQGWLLSGHTTSLAGVLASAAKQAEEKVTHGWRALGNHRAPGTSPPIPALRTARWQGQGRGTRATGGCTYQAAARDCLSPETGTDTESAQLQTPGGRRIAEPPTLSPHPALPGLGRRPWWLKADGYP